MFFILLGILFTVSLKYIHLRFEASHQLWNKLNVPNVPVRFPCGNFTETITKQIHFGVVFQKLYEQLKHADGYSGIYIFTQPCLFTSSPEFAKTILVRDFSSFMNRGIYYNPNDDPLSGNIFFHENQEWKNLRHTLSFAFTPAKMKMMFNTLAEVGNEFVDYIKTSAIITDEHCDIKELMACFTTDVISSCVFGLKGNSIRNSNSEFRYYGRRVMTFSTLKNIAFGVSSAFREQARKIGFRVFDKESTNFFYEMVRTTIEYRKKNNVKRNDLMQILIDMMNPSEDESIDALDLNDIAANAFIFFFAGFETSSTTLSVCLYYLAMNEDLQDEVRREINKILDRDEQLSYDNLNEMNLVERILLETLRLFPPVASLHRISNKPYKLPNGSEIPEGTLVTVPVLGFHYDSDIWPNPEKFDPNRFTDEEKQKRHPYAFLPFGEGYRVCIGQRFALMQTKVGLINLLRNFKVEVCERTEIPLKIDFTQVTYAPTNVWLKLSCLKKMECFSS